MATARRNSNAASGKSTNSCALALALILNPARTYEKGDGVGVGLAPTLKLDVADAEGERVRVFVTACEDEALWDFEGVSVPVGLSVDIEPNWLELAEAEGVRPDVKVCEALALIDADTCERVCDTLISLGVPDIDAESLAVVDCVGVSLARLVPLAEFVGVCVCVAVIDNESVCICDPVMLEETLALIT